MYLAETELPAGFWSYAHKDDVAEDGRILRLCERIKNEFSLLTGRDIEFFVDREAIAWGDKWRATIDDALTETTFFVPIVTPRFVASDECRRELVAFSENSKARGVPELLFPVLYVAVDDLSEESNDEVKVAIARTQYVSFTELRLIAEDSSEYRMKVNEMALRLISIANQIASKAEEPLVSSLNKENQDSFDEDSPGFLDAMGSIEGQIPEWNETIDKLGELITQIGEITHEYAPELSRAAERGSVAQIVVADKYSKAIQPVAEEFRSTGSKYMDQALAISENLIAILDELTNSTSESGLEAGTREFLFGILGVVDAGVGSASEIQEFQHSVRKNFGISRAIRKPLKAIDQGAQYYLDSLDLLTDWQRRIQEILELK
ncbi:Uncharacterised protein [Mycobacteroides abscessus subsp. abscessus]|uniref:toll/interleukin-1 receptor domain-containing protein n=1 Tax=Mycobacteroides abscessus TaxID=36809 RepID=UPI00092A8910|nr:toll/interleukin-1 receptor domain-containing protein [Mycobacteroides abscessus]SIL45921.1 Uncharacterised protein [Mycobacteroides abscessus subsp. abscessus]SLE84769.1 Uncharacterised protein [Mycobacteroides abscessus subsp. abscessus]